jgi:hypothetical protein
MTHLAPIEPWQKIASVTAGGKPYFYIAATSPGVYWRIVWDRWLHTYIISHDGYRGSFGSYVTPKQAMRAVADRFSRPRAAHGER